MQLGLRVEAMVERKLLLPVRHQPDASETVVLWLDDAGLGLQAIEKPLPAPVRISVVNSSSE